MDSVRLPYICAGRLIDNQAMRRRNFSFANVLYTRYYLNFACPTLLKLGQVVGQLGMFGFIINTIQASLLEYKLMKNGKWSAVTGESHY